MGTDKKCFYSFISNTHLIYNLLHKSRIKSDSLCLLCQKKLLILLLIIIGLARSGKEPPKGFMAPSAWKVLSEYYQSLKSKMDTN